MSSVWTFLSHVISIDVGSLACVGYIGGVSHWVGVAKCRRLSRPRTVGTGDVSDMRNTTMVQSMSLL